MTPWTRKLQAAVLMTALSLPAGTAVAQVSWAKPDSRTKGTVIGAVAGALVGGKKGAIVGGALCISELLAKCVNRGNLDACPRCY